MSDVVDNSELERMLARFSPDQLTKLTAQALREAGNAFGAHVTANVNASPLAGQRATRVKVDQYTGSMSVDIFGTPLARIFEGGSYKAAANGGRKVTTYKGKELATPANRGNVRAYRFLGAAFDAHGGEIPEIYENILAKLLTNE